jgi:hypothetical protein
MSLDVLKNVLLSLNPTILEFVTGRGSTPSDSDLYIRLQYFQSMYNRAKILLWFSAQKRYL